MPSVQRCAARAFGSCSMPHMWRSELQRGLEALRDLYFPSEPQKESPQAPKSIENVNLVIELTSHYL